MWMISRYVIEERYEKTSSNTDQNFAWKESINSDGQQFYQYHQNEQSPLT
jgi:hypothetical protein